MSIFLVRHAESESNVGSKTSDPATISLTEKGELTSIDFAANVNERPELIIITSYLRTYQTAYPLTKKYSDVQVETWPLHEFTYLSPASCRNTTTQDRRPMVNDYWEKCDPFLVHGPGAESFAEFSKRISSNLNKLQSLNQNNIFVFTHEQVIRMIRQLLEIGNLSPLDAMTYFRNKTLKFLVRNLEILSLDFDA